MAPRPKRRDQWRRRKDGTWTISLGARGHRVQLFENCDTGYYYRSVYVPGVGKNRKSLGTKDRTEAERLGRLLLAALLRGEAPRERTTVRLGEMCSAFLTESPLLADNVASSKKDAKRRCKVLCAVLGSQLDVSLLTNNDVVHYSARRRIGGIRLPDGEVTGVVRQRTIQADVKLLKQMLRWACTRPMQDGQRWLDRNPLEYIVVCGEHDVQRPVASYERFEATMAAIRKRQVKYASVARTTARMPERLRAERREQGWIRAELGLMLLEATGKRRGAIMGLRWQDIDFTSGRITWRPEFDKKRKTWVVPYPPHLFSALRDFQRRLGAVGGFVFPRSQDTERSAPPELLSQWIQKAESDAGLPKLLGGTCHPYRRKWRSERSESPTKAVMYAGGWSDVNTMLKCYDHPEDADILAVTAEPRKRREGVCGDLAVQTG